MFWLRNTKIKFSLLTLNLGSISHYNYMVLFKRWVRKVHGFKSCMENSEESDQLAYAEYELTLFSRKYNYIQTRTLVESG